jgi:hypothetical protein
MTDDLVKRLREHAIHLDAWGKEANHDADIVEEAANRIEKLEAALLEVLSLGSWGSNILARCIMFEALEPTDCSLGEKDENT